jgi:hypothetical protein
MSKSRDYSKSKANRWDDDSDFDCRQEIHLRRDHHKAKRIKNALRSKDIHSIFSESDDEED